MTTSGTVGLTTIPVIDIIDHSILRCGIAPAKTTSEMLDTARKNLFYYMQYLSNKGVNLWTIEKTILGLYKYQSAYVLPVGTIDVLNLNYRTIDQFTGTAISSAGGQVANAFDNDVTTYCVQTSTNGNISMTLGSSDDVNEVGIMPYGNAVYTLTWEYSTDNVTYTSVLTQEATSMVDGQWYWYTIPAPKAGQYFRVRETGGATLSVREIVFAHMPNEIPISRNNRDDFVQLPNKTQLSDFPTQYWYYRTIDQPQILLWPTPQNTFVSMVVWRWREIQDIGDLTNTIEMPKRWYECILANLAARNALDIPDVDPGRIDMLAKLAMGAEEPPYNEERDKAMSYFTPNIGIYTGSRGVRP